MPSIILSIRHIKHADLPALQPLIQRAYRGESAKAGWTHEAHLLDDERVGMDALAAMVDNPNETVLVGFEGDDMIGCVRVAKLDQDRAYLGLLCVDPLLQTSGYGKQLIAAAETTARDVFGAKTIEMTVIDSRIELISFYQRRGYTQVGTCDFPTPVDPPLHMVVLQKALG